VIPWIDYLEVHATVLSRARIERGLRRLRLRGCAIDWFVREGWWRTVFIVWGHPVLIAHLHLALGRRARHRPPARGGMLDVIA
jgi:hypothetical protein